MTERADAVLVLDDGAAGCREPPRKRGSRFVAALGLALVACGGPSELPPRFARSAARRGEARELSQAAMENTASGALVVQSVSRIDESPAAVALSPNGSLVAVVMNGGRVALLDAETAAVRATHDVEMREPTDAVSFNASGDRLTLVGNAGSRGLVETWDLTTNRVTAVRRLSGRITTAARSPRGRFIAFAVFHEDDRVHVLDIDQGGERVLALPAQAVPSAPGVDPEIHRYAGWLMLTDDLLAVESRAGAELFHLEDGARVGDLRATPGPRTCFDHPRQRWLTAADGRVHEVRGLERRDLGIAVPSGWDTWIECIGPWLAWGDMAHVEVVDLERARPLSSRALRNHGSIPTTNAPLIVTLQGNTAIRLSRDGHPVDAMAEIAASLRRDLAPTRPESRIAAGAAHESFLFLVADGVLFRTSSSTENDGFRPIRLPGLIESAIESVIFESAPGNSATIGVAFAARDARFIAWRGDRVIARGSTSIDFGENPASVHFGARAVYVNDKVVLDELGEPVALDVVARSPNNRYLVTVENRALHLRDVESGAVRRLRGAARPQWEEAGWAVTARVDATGRHVLIDASGVTTLFDGTTGRRVRNLRGGLIDAELAPDGSLVVLTPDDDAGLQLVRLPTGERVAAIPAGTGERVGVVESVFDSRGGLLASDLGELVVLDTTGTVRARETTSSARALQLAVRADLAVRLDEEGVIQYLDLASGAATTSRFVARAAIDEAVQRIAGCRDGVLVVADLCPTCSTERTLGPCQAGATLHWSPAGDFLAEQTPDYVTLHRTSDGARLHFRMFLSADTTRAEWAVDATPQPFVWNDDGSFECSDRVLPHVLHRGDGDLRAAPLRPVSTEARSARLVRDFLEGSASRADSRSTRRDHLAVHSRLDGARDAATSELTHGL